MKIRNLIFTLLALLLFGACVKDEINNTPHPDKGEVEIPINWGELPNIPGDTIIIIIGNDTIKISEGEQPEMPLLEPGEKEIIIINKPDGVTVDNGVAHADTTADGHIKPDVDDFYSGSGTITVKPDEQINVNIKPEKRTRQLIVNVKTSSIDITSISGTLSNIARSYNIKTNKEENPGTVQFPLGATTEGYTTSMNLFGIVGTPQTLTLTITYTDGTRQVIESDVTELMKDFNKDKSTPLIISNEMQVNIEAGFSATINNWILEKENISIN